MSSVERDNMALRATRGRAFEFVLLDDDDAAADWDVMENEAGAGAGSPGLYAPLVLDSKCVSIKVTRYCLSNIVPDLTSGFGHDILPQI